jgi:hypothetical protein
MRGPHGQERVAMYPPLDLLVVQRDGRVTTDRRKHPRLLVRIPVTLLVDDDAPLTAELVSLSAGGLFFIAAAPLSADRLISLTFEIEGRICAASGVIVRTTDGRGLGVSFTRTNDDLDALLVELGAMDEHARREHVSRLARVQIRVQAR